MDCKCTNHIENKPSFSLFNLLLLIENNSQVNYYSFTLKLKMNNRNFDVIIIGGGLAGLVSSIDLAQRGTSVLVIEKKNFPLHKVCGEYLSNEVRPYLKRLGFVPENLGAKKISRFMISSLDGASSTCEMNMGGFSISRYLLDKELFSIALNSGVKIVTDTVVTNVSFLNVTQFEVNTANKNYYTKVVLGAYGKRSNLDKEIRSKFFYKRTNYVGVKCHFKGDHEDDLVSLHNFEGGYCGISKIENGLLNISYLTTNNIVKRYKNTKELERFHLSKNPHLHAVFKNADSTFNKSLVVSQINFGIKQTVEKHVLMVGDAAGMIHPLCGNGMAMAIHGAKICVEQVSQFLNENISRDEMERQYSKNWDKQFKTRLTLGKYIEPLFGNKWTSNLALKPLKMLPGILPKLISLSHGKAIK